MVKLIQMNILSYQLLKSLHKFKKWQNNPIFQKSDLLQIFALHFFFQFQILFDMLTKENVLKFQIDILK